MAIQRDWALENLYLLLADVTGRGMAGNAWLIREAGSRNDSS